MKVLGSILFAALFVAVMLYKVKPEWFRPDPPKPPARNLAQEAVENTRRACLAYTAQLGAFFDQVDAASARIDATEGTPAQRAAWAQLAQALGDNVPALRAVRAPQVPVGDRHAAWVDSIDAFSRAIVASLAANDAGDPAAAQRAAAALEQARGVYHARKDDLARVCPS